MSIESGVKRTPDILKHYSHPLGLGAAVFAMRLYLRLYHRFEINIPDVPLTGASLSLTTHFSLLDVPALMAGDPRSPKTTFPVKKEIADNFFFGSIIKLWGAPTVDRGGKDIGTLRNLLGVLSEGKAVCIAAQGTRSRTGRLGPIDRALVDVALHVAARGIPIIPLAETGTSDALPPGRKFPRPAKIRLISGPPIDLSPWVGIRRSSKEEAFVGAATEIQRRLAQLLPEKNQPQPDERVLWTSAEYIASESFKETSSP